MLLGGVIPDNFRRIQSDMDEESIASVQFLLHSMITAATTRGRVQDYRIGWAGNNQMILLASKSLVRR